MCTTNSLHLSHLHIKLFKQACFSSYMRQPSNRSCGIRDHYTSYIAKYSGRKHANRAIVVIHLTNQSGLCGYFTTTIGALVCKMIAFHIVINNSYDTTSPITMMLLNINHKLSSLNPSSDESFFGKMNGHDYYTLYSRFKVSTIGFVRCIHVPAVIYCHFNRTNHSQYRDRYYICYILAIKWPGLAPVYVAYGDYNRNLLLKAFRRPYQFLNKYLITWFISTWSHEALSMTNGIIISTGAFYRVPMREIHCS